MDVPRLTISDGLRNRFSYRKFRGGAPRVLVLHGEYWVDVACGTAAERLGWEVRCVPLIMRGVMGRDMTARLVEDLVAFQPDYILSINLTGMDEGGLFARLFEDLHLPHVTWFVDDPRTIIMGRTSYATPYSIALTWEKNYDAYLQSVGFPVVKTMPLAVDESLFHASPPSADTGELAFVGTSMAFVAEEEWPWIGERPELAAAVTEALEQGVVTREHFARGLDAMIPGASERFDEHERRHAELYLFVEGTHRLRRALCESLAPEGIVVYGGEDWRSFFPAVRPPLRYGPELANVYRTSAINLNMTSIQMSTAVNQRVFDCPAAGGFLLTDAQSALTELFDCETEIVTYRDFDECRARIQEFRHAPKRRAEITKRARKRILAEHTYVHRMQAITQLVKERFG
ncbi:MAG TPA: glycosyltransferase [Candidatus Hydrogenedentes bacterium]|nr:glycosyltransferase [Candidatus Hydrogenedentota bacterium]HOS03424.1 glycosyltransferase [Candidatus Hydrogenedentota bacterium]